MSLIFYWNRSHITTVTRVERNKSEKCTINTKPAGRLRLTAVSEAAWNLAGYEEPCVPEAEEGIAGILVREERMHEKMIHTLSFENSNNSSGRGLRFRDRVNC